MKRRIIGIAGKAGVGKDTVADYLCFMHYFKKLAFADPLKEMTKCLGAPLPETREEKEGKHPVLDVTWRKLWQHLGTEGLRHLDPDVWVKLMGLRVKNTSTNVVISDLRFENEAQWIRDNGGMVWHIFREGVAEVGKHTSENGLRICSFDKLISNNSSIIELFQHVNTLVKDDEQAVLS